MWLQGVSSALPNLRLGDRAVHTGRIGWDSLVFSSNSDSVWNDENGLEMDCGDSSML